MIGPSYGGVWGLKSGFSVPRRVVVVWSVWARRDFSAHRSHPGGFAPKRMYLACTNPAWLTDPRGRGLKSMHGP